MSKTKRVSVMLDESDLDSIMKLKKNQYYDVSFAKLYKDLVKIGIEVMTKKGNK